DGIRDFHVTGVQTCALPILPAEAHVEVARTAFSRVREANPAALLVCDPVLGDAPGGLYIDEGAAMAIAEQLLARCDLVTPNAFRSEERRVGKEGRSRCAPRR